MKRREFLTRLSVGIVGAAVASRVPLAWIPSQVKRTAAVEWLRAAFNSYTDKFGEVPQQMLASTALFDAYADELVANSRINYGGITEHNTEYLFFKAVRVERWHTTDKWKLLMPPPGSYISKQTYDFWGNQNQPRASV